MVLFVDKQKNIYAINKNMQKEDVPKYEDAIWYEGDFSFEQGDEKEGFYKVFTWNGEKPVIEYESIIETPAQEPTMDEKIYAAVSKSQDEIRQEGANSVMEEMKKRGLIV